MSQTLGSLPIGAKIKEKDTKISRSSYRMGKSRYRPYRLSER